MWRYLSPVLGLLVMFATVVLLTYALMYGEWVALGCVAGLAIMGVAMTRVPGDDSLFGLANILLAMPLTVVSVGALRHAIALHVLRMFDNYPMWLVVTVAFALQTWAHTILRMVEARGRSRE